MAEPPNSKTAQNNFLKLHYLYYQATPKFLREVFNEFWEVSEGSKWSDDKADGQKLIHIKGVQNIVKNGKLQKKNIESGESRLWDLSLLIDIIIALKSAYPSTALSSLDINAFTKKRLEWLKSTRNKLAHASSIEMDMGTFQPLWDDTINVLTALGMKQEDITSSDLAGEDKSVDCENELKATELKNVGNQCFKVGNFLQAVLNYSVGIDLKGISQDMLGFLYSNRSAAFIELENFIGAKDDAKSAITLRPGSFKGYARLGKAYESLRQYIKAVFNYNLAIGLGDDSEKTLNSFEYCKMMAHKLRRCEATDPEMLRQKDLRNLTSRLTASTFLGSDQADTFFEGTSFHLVTMAHRYYLGKDGCPQDYEKAAEYFAAAAEMGDAEGLFNLGCMTQLGKGVGKDVIRGHKYIVEASKKPIKREYLPGSGLLYRNIGVMESWHQLGMAYQWGTAVKQSNLQALHWYRKAMEFGSGLSANNTAIIFDDGNPQNIQKAVDFWKLAVFLKTTRGAENLADIFTRTEKYRLAQEWYHYASYMGSIDIILRKDEMVRDSQLERTFDPELFKIQLKRDILRSSYLAEILSRIKANEDFLTEKYAEFLEGGSSPGVDILEKGKAVRAHRDRLKKVQKLLKHEPNTLGLSFTKAATLIVPSSGVELGQMEEIFWNEIKQTIENKVFKGRFMKLKVIEDAIFGYPSICLLVEDNRGDVGSLFVYNYPQVEQTHYEIGYGCQFNLIYPHYRSMADGTKGLRVDDPQLIFKQLHLRSANRCRFCGVADGNKVKCRKCLRVSYCSKICLKKDADEYDHSPVCFKHLLPCDYRQDN